MPHYLFVTGKLAEPALREVLVDLAPRVGFSYDVAVLNITVASLMTPSWVAKRLQVPAGMDCIYVPGACEGDWSILQETTGVPVTPGPPDVRDLPDYFGQVARLDYGKFDITILAEINHAPRLSREELLRQALLFHSQGADVIDLGCVPGLAWDEVGDTVQVLKDHGMRVSIDTFYPEDANRGAKAGAELILSVNSTNREMCRDWGCEVVAVPDTPLDLDSLDATVDYLTRHHVPHRLDPILEPIGFGFTKSLHRYILTRAKYPHHEMLMGIGNLTELTETDSGPMNLLLLGICQELGIRSVLTTAVANWAATSVAECDIARRITHYAIRNQTLPKKLDDRLVTLRDRKVRQLGPSVLDQLVHSITDPNYRLFAEASLLHLVNGAMHLKGIDPFVLFDEVCRRDPKMDVSHAFYLGYEMAKAKTALTLRKNYVQDQALRWGYLSEPEISHRQHTGGDRAPG